MFMSVCLLPILAIAQDMPPQEEDEIEMLEVIEITGTVVEDTPRNMIFPTPQIPAQLHIMVTDQLALPKFELIKPFEKPSTILLDETAKNRNIHTPVKPLKTDHPPFPRRAREQGWHGRVILRLAISSQGQVQSANIHQSSGHPLLDDSAVKAATQWQFQPAKNGAFPVASIVNIPIQFDLVK